jgi:hypothetical protein
MIMRLTRHATLRKILIPVATVALAAGLSVGHAPSPAAATVRPALYDTYIYGYYLSDDDCIDEGQVGIDYHDWVDYSCYYTETGSGFPKEFMWALEVRVRIS